MRVLYVSTEVFPALKTGGLGDVNGALPGALIALGIDVRFLLPGFPALLAAARGLREVASAGHDPAVPDMAIRAGKLGEVPAFLADSPSLYGRAGNPYVGPGGGEWSDNAWRFATLARNAARFADGAFDGWRPDVVHAHDWHAGLVPAYLAARGGERPASVFTVHNLGFQGHYPAAEFTRLGLPGHFFAMHGVEFHGELNFMKAGLHYADRITTVSPTYAREIQSPELGFGMDGVLRARAGALTGILNGIDIRAWNPATDASIAARYQADDLSGKRACATALRQELGLAGGRSGPLFCVVSRLTTQKGIDLVLDAIPRMVAQGGGLAVLGAGERGFEEGFRSAARAHPGAVSVRVGYDEALAHRMLAGADAILVPSRFEPCGLTQMYGLAYGTLPVVRRVGGLADTVHDASPGAIADGSATGFIFERAGAGDLAGALDRVFALWREPAAWTRVQRNAMRENHGWPQSARRYADIYRELRPHA